ncbi:MAG: putative membrane protein, partial [Saprospiraceae bacterium]
MRLQKDLNELIEAQIISPEIAGRINDYYQRKSPESNNRMFIAFGILGAILVGLGIILILAHNWDDLSRPLKLFFAFLPLLIGQGFCGYTILKKYESTAWRESTAVFLVFAVGSSIALVSQIYNIPGDMSSFLLTWLLLCLPMIYIMRSSFVSLLYLAGVTWYACDTGYGHQEKISYWYYWPLFLAAIPHYYLLYKNKPESNFMTFHNWLVPLSLIITLGTLAVADGELMFIAYISLFGIFYLIGNFTFLKNQSLFRNGYRVLGAFGTVVLLLVLSFNDMWKDLRGDFFNTNIDEVSNTFYTAPEFWIAIILTLLAGVFLFRQLQKQSLRDIEPIAPVFLLFFIIFFIGMYSPIAAILINLLVFAIGLLTIRKGGNENHLGILNYGLLVITALTICRFFDTDLSFVWRGILFVAVGL